uniref:NolQa protein n=1 Tax=Rhizobium meliloti TaxID=382 RepID=Q52973_RHIML|nr:nolQa [Sinorhizobium meliloti]
MLIDLWRLLPSGIDGVADRAFVREWKENDMSQQEHQLRPASIRTPVELVETCLVMCAAARVLFGSVAAHGNGACQNGQSLS